MGSGSSRAERSAKKKFQTKTTYKIKKGETLTITVAGKAKTVKNVCKTSNAKVAKVISKKNVTKVKIRGRKKGKATITLKVNGITYKNQSPGEITARFLPQPVSSGRGSPVLADQGSGRVSSFSLKETPNHGTIPKIVIVFSMRRFRARKGGERLQICVTAEVCQMAKKTIQSIKEAELKAQQTVKDAEAEKAAILKKAREEGAAQKAELTGRAKDAAKKAVEDVEKTRDAALVKATVRAEAVIGGFQKDIQKKREAAIEAVISEIA